MTGARVDDPQAWPVQRTAYARARLDWRGHPGEIISEEVLYDLTGKHLKQEAADRAKSEQLLHQGVLGALNGQSYQETRRHLGVISGGREAEFEPALKAGHATVLKEFRVDELTAVRPLYEVFAESMQLTQVQKLHEGDALDAFTVYAKSDQAGRMRILSGIALLAREDSVDVTDFFERFGDSWFKGNLEIHGGLTANRMRRNREALDELLKEGVLPAGIPRGGVPDLEGILFGEGGDWQDRYDRLANWRSEVLLPGEDEGGENIVQRRMTAEERTVLEQQRDQIEGISKFFSDAQASGIRIKHDAETLAHRGLLDTLGDTAVMMGGSLPEMTMAAASGGILLPALFTSHYERHLAALRALNPTVAEARLAATAFGAALTDTALARFELVFAGGKLPLVRGALAKLGAAEGKLGVLTARAAAAGGKLAATGLPGRAAVNALKFTGRATGAVGTEVLQNVAPEAWQAVTHALHQEIRGPEWDTVVERERAALGDTALVSMGFLVIFGGGRLALESMGEGKLRGLLTDRRALALQGLSPADVEIVVQTAQHSPAAAADLAKQAADTTPVEERRERVRISWEEMMHEQQQVQTQLTQQRQMQQMQQMEQGKSDNGTAPRDVLLENSSEQDSPRPDVNGENAAEGLLQSNSEQREPAPPEKKPDQADNGARGPTDGEALQPVAHSDLSSPSANGSSQEHKGPASDMLPGAFEKDRATLADTLGDRAGDGLTDEAKQVEPAAEWTKHPGFQKPADDKGRFLGEIGNSSFALSDDTADAVGLPRGSSIPWREGIPDFVGHVVPGPRGIPGTFSVPGLTGVHKSDRELMVRQMAAVSGMSGNAVKRWLKTAHVHLHHSGGDGAQIVPRSLHELHHSGGAQQRREGN
ncbi:hypothetical protein [Luteolibacter sp. Populi]|uniref:hypothetical protein n=1 Tax=Luteolibacter sp. Populi TaxID=3230487 RepID=UPI003466BC73